MSTVLSPRRVLITGGCGRIGTLLASGLAQRYTLGLLDRRLPPAGMGLLFAQADITKLDDLRSHFEGYDTIIHLAADPAPDAPWESLQPNNIVGALNVVATACATRCRRVIFASSLYVVKGYPSGTYINSTLPPCPDTLYGASKAWGESLARVYAAASSTSILCIRIGIPVGPHDPRLTPGHRQLDWFVMERDLVALFAACIDAPASVHFGIFHGVSKQPGRHFDLSEAEARLGYRPQDDASSLAWRNYRSLVRRLLTPSGRLSSAIMQRADATMSLANHRGME